MSWLNHPSFRRLLEELRPRLQSKNFTFRRLSPIAFLCGGAQSSRRDFIAKHLHARFPQMLTFYADEVWNELASRSGMNALQMEAFLGRLSDIVIVVVESPGTYAEIGAFSLSDVLRLKLLPIVDIRFQNQSSFIRTGPLRWIDSESSFAPTIWVDLDSVLRCADEVDDRVDRIPKSSAIKLKNIAESPKHQLFLVCDYVGIFGPCSASQMVRLLEGTTTLEEDYAHTLLGVARAMGLVRARIGQDGETYYLPRLRGDHLKVHMRKKFLDVPRMRLEVLSVLQRIPDARDLLVDANN